MSLYEATFNVKHECPYRTVSEDYPGLTIQEWFMNTQQILEISAPKPPTEEVLNEIETLGPVLYDASNDSTLYMVIRSSQCSLDDSLITRFEAHNCLYMPPTIYQEGWEHYTVTAFDDRDIRELLRELDKDRDVEVLSTKSVETRHVPHSLFTSIDSLFQDFTTRQLEALRLALDNGYFEQPRKISVKEIANQTNIARSTFEEHLRKAENKLINNTENFVRLMTVQDAETDLLEGRTRISKPPS